MIQIEKFTKNYPLVCLVAANIVPLYGVAFAGWDAFSILLLYWAENVIIGTYGVLKMVLVKVDKSSDHLAKLWFIPFFIFHYSLFSAVHGMAILAIFGKEMEMFKGGQPHLPCFFLVFELLFDVIKNVISFIPAVMVIAIAGLGISHGVSFVTNFLLKGEYQKTNIGCLMFAPYGRVAVMHMVIFCGGVLCMVFGSPAMMLVPLIVIKTFIDSRMHLRERQKMQTASAKVRLFNVS